jgi:hypothetical protein
MLKKILGFAATGLVVLGIFIFTRPDAFHVERSTVVGTPPEAPFALVNDLHGWEKWSPFEKLDANLERSYSSPSAGVGAHYAWKGKKTGVGEMTIRTSEPSSIIGLDLEFKEPFVASNQVTFTFVPADGGTKVTWAMDGKRNFLAKAIGLILDPEKMVGPDFDQGLAALKLVAESTPRGPTAASEAGQRLGN